MSKIKQSILTELSTFGDYHITRKPKDGKYTNARAWKAAKSLEFEGILHIHVLQDSFSVKRYRLTKVN